MKGQLEFIAVLGIIIVVIVVGIYALQTGIVQNPVANPDTRLVQDSTENFIRNAVRETLKSVSDNGGYLEPQQSDAVYMGRGLAYWMKSGRLNIPNIRSNIVSGISDYIGRNKDSFATTVSGKNVTFGQPRVTVNILDNQLTVAVDMPTSVNGVQVPQPYSVTVPTKIGEVIDFSTGFALQEAEGRYFEYFLLSSMILSPYEGFAQQVPVFIYLTGCGEFVFKTWFDVQPRMEELVRSTLAHTYMPDKYPVGSGIPAPQSGAAPSISRTISSANTIINSANGSEEKITELSSVEYEIADYPEWDTNSTFLKYAVPDISGKKHFDLDVSFGVQDGFSINRANMQMSPEVITETADVIPMTGACMSKGLAVYYYLRFPVVVKVKDPLTGNVLRFAVEAYIRDNKPGDWNSGKYNLTIQSSICRALGCDANVKVADSTGKPLAGAGVTYMGCSLGITGSDGVLSAKAPCGYGPLEVYRSGYDVFSKGMDMDAVADASVTLAGMPVLNAHLNEVVIDRMGGTFPKAGSSYMVPAAGLGDSNLPGLNPINSFSQRDSIGYLNFIDLNTGKFYDRFLTDRVSSIGGIPSGSYVVSGALMNKAMTEIYGSFSVPFNITDAMGGTDIYVYFPYIYEYNSLSNKTERIDGGLALTSMLGSCGMGPVSVRAWNGTLPCAWGLK